MGRFPLLTSRSLRREKLIFQNSFESHLESLGSYLSQNLVCLACVDCFMQGQRSLHLRLKSPLQSNPCKPSTHLSLDNLTLSDNSLLFKPTSLIPSTMDPDSPHSHHDFDNHDERDMMDMMQNLLQSMKEELK